MEGVRHNPVELEQIELERLLGALSQDVHKGIVRDAIDPRRKATRRIEITDIFVHRNEHILNDVAYRIFRGEEAPSVAEQFR